MNLNILLKAYRNQKTISNILGKGRTKSVHDAIGEYVLHKEHIQFPMLFSI